MDITKRRMLTAGGTPTASPLLLRGLTGQMSANTAEGNFEVTTRKTSNSANQKRIAGLSTAE